jgi:uncharacterized protein YjlB
MPLRASAGGDAAELGNDRAVVLMMLDGDCELRWSSGQADVLELTRGNTVVIPAALVGECVLTTVLDAKLLRVTTLGT